MKHLNFKDMLIDCLNFKQSSCLTFMSFIYFIYVSSSAESGMKSLETLSKEPRMPKKIKRIVISASMVISTQIAYANDGGIAVIKVNEIKMREYKIINHQETEVRRIADPYYKIILKGDEASKLQKILPSVASVITTMQPELKEQFDKTFKNLGIYNPAKEGISEKVMTFECNDGELVSMGNGKFKIVKAGESTCKISIYPRKVVGDNGDIFGDGFPWEPKSCK